MSRGLITIATGNIHYYEIAANLLMSYKYFAKEPLPFAIICEEENEYTALFDEVIVTAEAKRSFMDKFLLLKLSPFDEALFFDADSLAFGDLNAYWDFFEGATDFSSIGQNFPLGTKGAWYNLEDIGEYAEKIPYTSRVHMGICYIRQSDKLEKLYQDCNELERNFHKLHFHTCPNSVDECILGIAMPMNNMKVIEEKVDMLATYPCLRKIHADILNDKLSYTTKWGTASAKGILVHWGTAYTYAPLYRFNVESLALMVSGQKDNMSIKNIILYKYKFRLLWLQVLWFFQFCRKMGMKIVKKIVEILRKD